MSAHRTLNDFFRAFDSVGPGRLNDPGDAGTITVDMWGQVCSVVTESAETRTLAQPTKPGILAAVVLDTDGGDLTLTVTGGYKADSQTSITFDDAGDFVVFYSVEVGSSYYWRVVAQEGTNADMGSSVTAEHGDGAIGTGVAPATYRYTRDGDIITEIQVDLTGLGCEGTAAKDAIGLNSGGDPAYIGRYVTATCGIVYRVELICLEAPGEDTATITSDIDLGADDEDDIAYDDAVDDVVVNTGGLSAGESYVNDAPGLTANDYLYLIEGDTAATSGVYDAGQVIVRLTGRPLLT